MVNGIWKSGSATPKPALGGRQELGAFVRSEVDLVALIGWTLDSFGRTAGTTLTGVTDRCPGLRSILAVAGVTTPPDLDRFRIAMRLQHLEQTASGLSIDNQTRREAKAVIAARRGGRATALIRGSASARRFSARSRMTLRPFVLSALSIFP